MNRLQKKCIIAAGGIHALLVLVLIVGPGFLMSSSKPENLPELTFLPIILTDSTESGGGNPKGGPPPPPPPQQVTPPPAPVQTPPQPIRTPPPEPVRTPDPVPSLESTRPPKRVIKIDPTVVTRNTSQVKADQQKSADERAKAAADEQRRIASAIKSAVSGIQSGLTPSTSIELKGPGTSGLPYGNWLQAVKKVYTDAWVVPDGVTDDSATVTVSVTIARDGSVISSSVVRSSSNGLVNHSVEAALNRVRYAPPLPDGAKESQRTVTINFNLKAKQSIG